MIYIGLDLRDSSCICRPQPSFDFLFCFIENKTSKSKTRIEVDKYLKTTINVGTTEEGNNNKSADASKI